MLEEARLAERTGLTEEEVRSIVRDELEKGWKKDPATKKMAIIASRGTLDWAYPPLNLACTAAASGMEVSVFFTFYGLNIIRRDSAKRLKITPVGNPGMPMPVPMPDIISALPGMTSFATWMMRGRMRKHNVNTIAELLDLSKELGVRLIACDFTFQVFGYREEDFIDGVEFGGAAAFLSQARRAHTTLFI